MSKRSKTIHFLHDSAPQKWMQSLKSWSVDPRKPSSEYPSFCRIDRNRQSCMKHSTRRILEPSAEQCANPSRFAYEGVQGKEHHHGFVRDGVKGKAPPSPHTFSVLPVKAVRAKHITSVLPVKASRANLIISVLPMKAFRVSHTISVLPVKVLRAKRFGSSTVLDQRSTMWLFYFKRSY